MFYLSFASILLSAKSIHAFCLSYSSGSSWLKVTPWGIRQGLDWIKTRYNNVPVYVTENGVSDNNGTISDQHRIDYLKAYINEVLKGNVLTLIMLQNVSNLIGLMSQLPCLQQFKRCEIIRLYKCFLYSKAGLCIFLIHSVAFSTLVFALFPYSVSFQF